MRIGVVEESQRLESQHVLVTQSAGNILVEKPIWDSFEIRKVLEIATGTGIWLSHLSQKLPQNAELIGHHVSSDQFPDPHARPANVKLEIHDASIPLPAQYLTYFDLVNIRFLTFGLENGHYKSIAENVFASLKPGGWFQWMEACPLNIAVENHQYPFLRELQRNANIIFQKLGRDPRVIEEIPQHMRSVGFEHVRERELYFYYGTPAEGNLELKKCFAENMRSLSMSLMSLLLKMGGSGSIQCMGDVVQQCDEAAREIMEGHRNMLVPIKITIGQKPK